MEDTPIRWTEPEAGDEENAAHAARLLLTAISATIYSSGENYGRALEDFFAQIEALGLVIGASDLDDVSAYLRRTCRPI